MSEENLPATDSTSAYRVLARKYRPGTFAQLIGQEAMVRTLTNAFSSGRLAHAFLLTGVRGVGKTTTARIIARALNCVGTDGAGDPTIAPCGVCAHCRAIAEDRHVDVLEVDAASRTKVEQMRELLDGVPYRPTSARYKVYIIDEVHMLSQQAFNALLKTLEEPPEHVKFIFATTEVRKVPVTVLSRCQRFDLRRVDRAELARHFGRVAEAEGARVSAPALDLIARAADGSVRDGLSLLDQAIAHGGGQIDEDAVRRMLGLADRTLTFDLTDAAMRGDVRAALAILDDQYAAGADPAVVIEDMLELVHWLTRIKMMPEVVEGPDVAEAERVRGRAMAHGLAVPALARAWQMLLKGLGEARTAPSPRQAAEMVLVRLAYAADLPTPAEIIKDIAGGGTRPPGGDGGGPGRGPAGPAASADGSASHAGKKDTGDGPRSPRVGTPPVAHRTTLVAGAAAEARPRPEAEAADPRSFEEVVALVGTRKEALLQAHLYNNAHLVRFEPGRIEFRPDDHAPADLANRLSRFLNEATARRWVVSVAQAPGAATLHRQDDEAAAVAKAEAARHPLVKAVLEAFPGATIESVARRGAAIADEPLEGSDEP